MSLYSDLNSINPTTSGQPLLPDVEAIYQSLYNLFGMIPGDLLFSRAGFALEDEVFELIDDVTALQIYNDVIIAIGEWEPRVVPDTRETQIIPKPDENAYELNLVFSIKGLVGQTFTFQGSFTQ